MDTGSLSLYEYLYKINFIGRVEVAMTLHLLVASYSLATALVDAWLEHNKTYTGDWT